MQLMLLFAGLFALAQLFALFKMLQIYLGVTKRQAVDVTHENRPFPTTPLDPTRATLTALGFHRLGEYQVTNMPGHPVNTTWVFIDADGTVFAEAVVLPARDMPLIQFASVFNDNATIETSYPIGENFDMPMYRSRKVTTTIGEAYRAHLALLDEFRLEHGQPRRMNTIAQHISWDTIHREHYARRKMRPTTTYQAIVAAWAVYIFVWAFLYTLLRDDTQIKTIVLPLGAPIVLGGIYMFWHNSLR
jgi:hypothetical protein